MKRLLLLGLTLCLLSACAMGKGELLPKLARTPGASEAQQRCAALFPQGRWQFVHAIAFRLADGTSGNALGVLVLDGQAIKSALMTVEGLTLFEARSSEAEELEVLRALPPFDNREFASGLMRDVRTLFLAPPGLGQYGTLADGTPVCRFNGGQMMTDILPQADGCWQLHTYSEHTSLRTDGCQPADPRREQRRTRTVNAGSCGPVGSVVLPHTLELTGTGPAGYTLNLRLVSAEPLPASP
jgi:hypothetical protein